MDAVQSTLLDYAFSYFRKHGDWPLAHQVDLELDVILDPVGGLEAVCASIGEDLIRCGSPNSQNDKVAIRLRGLELFPESRQDIQNFLAVTRFFASRYRESGGADKEVSLDEFPAKLSPDEAKRLENLILNEGVYWQGASGQHFTLSRFVGKLADVKSVDDYLNRYAAFVERQRNRSPSSIAVPDSIGRHVFLSHAASDTKLANYLADVIRTSVGGVEVFVASSPGEIPTGEEWLTVIKDRLKAADTYLILLTPQSITRLWLWFETGAAWMSERRMLPVTALGLEKSEVPMPLGAHQALSLEEESDVKQLFRDLRIAVADVSRFCATVKEFSGEVEKVPGKKGSTPLASVLERARAKRAALDYEQNLASPEGRRAVHVLVGEFFNAVQSAADRANAAEPGLRFRMGRIEDQLVIQGTRKSLSIVWENRSPHSTKEIVIYVIEVDGRLNLPGEQHFGGPNTKKQRTIHYSLGLDQGGSIKWVEESTHKTRGSAELGEYWVSELVRQTYELE